MAFNLGNIGNAMYFSTQAANDQLAQQRQKDAVQLEQQQIQQNTQKMAQTVAADKELQSFYRDKLPQAMEMGQMGAIQATEQEAIRVSSIDPTRGKILFDEAKQQRADLQIQDKERKNSKTLRKP